MNGGDGGERNRGDGGVDDLLDACGCVEDFQAASNLDGGGLVAWDAEGQGGDVGGRHALVYELEVDQSCADGGHHLAGAVVYGGRELTFRPSIRDCLVIAARCRAPTSNFHDLPQYRVSKDTIRCRGVVVRDSEGFCRATGDIGRSYRTRSVDCSRHEADYGVWADAEVCYNCGRCAGCEGQGAYVAEVALVDFKGPGGEGAAMCLFVGEEGRRG